MGMHALLKWRWWFDELLIFFYNTSCIFDCCSPLNCAGVNKCWRPSPSKFIFYGSGSVNEIFMICEIFLNYVHGQDK